MATDTCERVGKRIRALRRKRGWTQRILADHAELSREQVCWIEQAKSEPRLGVLLRLAQALDVSPSDFFA